MVEEFRQHYIRLCTDHNVETQDAILEQLKIVSTSTKRGGHALNLSSHSLSTKTCAILGKLFSTDKFFCEIRLNDCMLSEEGLKAIANGLAANTSCRKVDLKGNNIRSSGAEALGYFLKQNKVATRLSLEWNSVGMLQGPFGRFCDGLSMNKSLQYLDLRNNQITHEGAADLAQAIISNEVLQVLDLRWNNIGLVGGRSLLDAIQQNKQITKLEIAGNNIPVDIMKAIDSNVALNAERAGFQHEYSTRTKMLSSELQQLKQEKSAEMSNILHQMDKQEEALRQTNRTAMERISSLQEALEERKAAFHNMATKLSLAESELAVCESKVAELSASETHLKELQQEAAKKHQRELQHEREERALSESRLNKEIMEKIENIMTLENKVDELERKTRMQQEEIFSNREHHTHLQAELKLKTAQFDDRVLYEKQKAKETCRDTEEQKEAELAKQRQSADETEHAYKERIAKLQAERTQLEEEISRQKQLALMEKTQAETVLYETKTRLKSEEDERVNLLNEKLRSMTQSRDEAATITELQAKNSNQVLENEHLKHKLESLSQELMGKSAEMQEEVGKVRLELNQRIQKLESERLSQTEFYDKINKLEKTLAEAQTSLAATTEEKDKNIRLLQEQLKARENDMERMTREDRHRTVALQEALQSFSQRSPYAGQST